VKGVPFLVRALTNSDDSTRLLALSALEQMGPNARKAGDSLERLLLDASDFREGERSLSITFEGPGISDAGIRQWIPVHAGTPYEFTAYYKSSEFQGAGGPQLVLRDLYTGQAVYTSDPLNGADFWKAVHARFTTLPSTNLLVLNIERIPPGSPMRGKIWLDDFQLSTQSSEVQP